MPNLRAALRRGEGTVLGTWLTQPAPAVAELMARLGFAFVTVDLEHSSLGLDQAGELIRAVDLAGSAPLVRLSSHDHVQLKRVMDAGAHGVIVPMVTAREQLDAVHAAMHYPPRGKRGVGLARAQAWGEDFEGYRQRLEANAVLVAQLEHADVLEDLDAVLSHPGLDGVLIGPYDLSASLGHSGEFDHPDVVAALDRIRRAALAHGVPAGLHIVEPDPAELRRRIAEGYRLLAYSVDFRMLAAAAHEGLAVLREP